MIVLGVDFDSSTQLNDALDHTTIHNPHAISSNTFNMFSFLKRRFAKQDGKCSFLV